MIRCAIIDDEPYARDLLREFISKIPELQMIGSYSSALQAVGALAADKIDLVFLDIQMPDLSGVDFLKSLEHRPMIIFTTAYAEYAIEGFELDVIDYLLKPFDFQRFLKGVNKAFSAFEKREETTGNPPRPEAPNDFIFIKDGTKLVKVDFADILFIKGTREYVTIHERSRKIMSLQTMKSLEHDLPANFVRVHNSFIVNIRAIGSVDKDEVHIAGEDIPIGITYKKAFLDALKKYSSR